MRDEVRKITAEYEADNKPLTAEAVVEAAKDARKYPALHEHLWQVSADVLVTEARVARAHRLLISVRIVTEEGDSVRLLTHTPGVAGYRATTHVVTQLDLASMKLRQLTDDIARSRMRLREFRTLVPTLIADGIDEALEQAERKAADAIAEREPAAA